MSEEKDRTTPCTLCFKDEGCRCPREYLVDVHLTLALKVEPGGEKDLVDEFQRNLKLWASFLAWDVDIHAAEIQEQ